MPKFSKPIALIALLMLPGVSTRTASAECHHSGSPIPQRFGLSKDLYRIDQFVLDPAQIHAMAKSFAAGKEPFPADPATVVAKDRASTSRAAMKFYEIDVTGLVEKRRSPASFRQPDKTAPKDYIIELPGVVAAGHLLGPTSAAGELRANRVIVYGSGSLEADGLHTSHSLDIEMARVPLGKGYVLSPILEAGAGFRMRDPSFWAASAQPGGGLSLEMPGGAGDRYRLLVTGGPSADFGSEGFAPGGHAFLTLELLLGNSGQ